MTAAALADAYHRYIACLNERALQRLGDHVDADVCYNDARLGLEGYRALLEDDFRSIPDLRFDVQLLVCEPPRVASRLRFDCTPAGTLFGLAVNGQRVRFSENVFYEFSGGRIARVWSIIDTRAIAAQL